MSIGFGFERLGLLTLKFPIFVALFVALLTGLAVSQLPKASFDGDLLRVYKNSGEMYDRYERLRAVFGTFENDAYVLVRSPNMTDPETIETLRELAFDLELSTYATGTLSPFSLRKPSGENRTTPAVPENMQTREEVAAALDDLRANDPLMRNLILDNHAGVVMIMFPDRELTRGKGEALMLAELRELIAEYRTDDIQIELTGPPVWKTEMLDASVDDQIKFSIFGFLIGALVSVICLRSIGGAILATLTPLVSVVWVVGAVVVMFGSFTFLTNIVTTLVLVLAFAESMYFCFTWLRLWREGMEPNAAIAETVMRVTPAAALTTITTMISFASLSIARGQGIEEFAISGVIAVGITFLTLVTFLPLALMLAIKLGFKPPEKVSIAVEAPIPIARRLVKKYYKFLAVGSLVVMAGLFFPHFIMQPRFDFKDFLPKDSDSLVTAKNIDNGVGGVAPIYIRIPLKDGQENVTDSDFATIEKVHKILEKNIGDSKVISAASFTHYSDSGFTREQIFKAVGPFLKRRFITDDGTEALVTGFLPTLMESDRLREIVQNTDADLAAAGIEGAEVAGFNVLTAFASTDIIGSLRNGLTLAVLINIAIIGVAFRSIRVAIVSIVPNFLPILGTELYLYVSGAGLQLTTVIALTIAFGIAVDDTIHFMSTYTRARRDGNDHLKAVDLTLERIGPALVATTLILCAGTFIVVFSSLPPVALFGTLTVLTLILALVGDLLVLPSLLIAGGRFFHPIGKVSK